MSASAQESPLLRDGDVAVLLSVRPDTVRRWAARGEIPSIRLGRLLRFRSADVDQTCSRLGASVRTSCVRSSR
jgi:excisionase family DNA binding protein